VNRSIQSWNRAFGLLLLASFGCSSESKPVELSSKQEPLRSSDHIELAYYTAQEGELTDQPLNYPAAVPFVSLKDATGTTASVMQMDCLTVDPFEEFLVDPTNAAAPGRTQARAILSAFGFDTGDERLMSGRYSPTFAEMQAYALLGSPNAAGPALHTLHCRYDATGQVSLAPYGLTATYFDKPTLSGRRYARVDPEINFNWGSGTPTTLSSPAPRLPHDFSVRWSGRLTASVSEVYTFITTTDDGIRLRVDGQTLIDKWEARGVTENRATMPLVAGRSYRIEVDFSDTGGGALAVLEWSSPSTARQAIPREAFTPDVQGSYRLYRLLDNGSPKEGYYLRFNDPSVRYDEFGFSVGPAAEPVYKLSCRDFLGATPEQQAAAEAAAIAIRADTLATWTAQNAPLLELHCTSTSTPLAAPQPPPDSSPPRTVTRFTPAKQPALYTALGRNPLGSRTAVYMLAEDGTVAADGTRGVRGYWIDCGAEPERLLTALDFDADEVRARTTLAANDPVFLRTTETATVLSCKQKFLRKVSTLDETPSQSYLGLASDFGTLLHVGCSGLEDFMIARLPTPDPAAGIGLVTSNHYAESLPHLLVNPLEPAAETQIVELPCAGLSDVDLAELVRMWNEAVGPDPVTGPHLLAHPEYLKPLKATYRKLLKSTTSVDTQRTTMMTAIDTFIRALPAPFVPNVVERALLQGKAAKANLDGGVVFEEDRGVFSTFIGESANLPPIAVTGMFRWMHNRIINSRAGTRLDTLQAFNQSFGCQATSDKTSWFFYGNCPDVSAVRQMTRNFYLPENAKRSFSTNRMSYDHEGTLGKCVDGSAACTELRDIISRKCEIREWATPICSSFSTLLSKTLAAMKTVGGGRKLPSTGVAVGCYIDNYYRDNGGSLSLGQCTNKTYVASLSEDLK
jgi:hypothetical protein